MSFEYTDEDILIRDSVRKFMDKEIIPIVSEYEKNEIFPWEILEKLKEFGYLGGILPENEGGMGISHKTHAILMEEAGRVWMSMRGVVNGICIISYALSKFGTKYQKVNFLFPILEANKKCWLGITEPNVGSDAGAVETKADKQKDGYIINGTKMFITNGAIADVGLLLASTDRKKGHKGLTAFIVDNKVTSFSTRPLKALSLRALSTAELHFDDAFVPACNVVGEEGKGLNIIHEVLNLGRLNVACGAVGLAQACLDSSLKYAKERRQFGKLIGEFQLVQNMIVEIATLVETSRLLSYKAADALDAGKKAVYECSMAKMYCTEAAFRAAHLALQVHGGMGYMEEMPIERYFRDARAGTIPEGTTQIQTLILGRELLGLSAFK